MNYAARGTMLAAILFGSMGAASVTCSMTAFGSTPRRSCMKVPLSSAKGPNDIAFLQPTTSVKKSTACFMSGTVMPVWSPRMPGIESAMVRCGYGSNIELFKYTAPDQKDLTPKNSDIGGFHIALYVDDVAAAKAYLDGKGVKTRMGPLPVKEGPAAGQTILYFQAPWGLQLEAISYADGMAYEKGAETVLWSPKNPEK
ncbi:glyoxalase/bleomycin resistance/dioxygenase family protein [Mesorhizobium sp. C416B]|uniref:glyoxalase/bleomycin resistance/dioxygenase family protein n=1 Tax=unclassified Mesorhizobium TaxID=325217 RepID=UPI0003CF7558|nr:MULTISPECIES: glyoxalase/bleomycin resistance/dioxygenase family protein [unclassified Mesorhizobium]ESX52373.1 glyoxalase [Mesorhizobium sp. LSHC426A00]ESX58718.1 glyoxalase [Mesorhizobium sp. LSHC424B00]WJI65042.1 glyoxalase/bleomycin resistance/dioxygenase family protein [Mesorhizobium sp. C416B]